MSLYSDQNSRARINNAGISSSRLPLEVLLTPQNDEPPGFPANSAQLAALTGMSVFQGIAERSY